MSYKGQWAGDTVNAPAHYCEGRKYEPRHVLTDWFLDKPYLWNAGKYLARAGRKGSKEDALRDLEKAIQYIEFHKELIQSGE
jgi:hypothetical protein